MMLQSVTLENLPDIARGAGFLGTGGGGDPYVGLLMAQIAVERFGSVEVVQMHDVPDDAAIFSAAMIGAPSVFNEKIPSGDDIVASVEGLAAKMGRKPQYIVPFEIGGCNSMVPIVAAARLGVPIIDADGMGRAFPELQMVTFNVAGVSCTPILVVDEHGRSVLIDAETAKAAEDIARANCIHMGMSAMFSSYPMLGADLKHSAIEATLSLAWDIGKAIGQPGGKHPLDSLLHGLRASKYYCEAQILGRGKITDIDRRTSGGFTVGKCTIGLHDAPASIFEIEFQNENLLARRDGRIIAMVPDLISIVDEETAEPITSEGLRFGQRIAVMGTCAAPIMRTDAALEVFGPRAFGIDTDFVKIEELGKEFAV